MMIFHGGGEEIRTPEIRVGATAKDFGLGFYCTVIREQAERWARRKPIPVVNGYQVDRRIELETLKFPKMSEEWLDFIVQGRSNKPGERFHPYDCIEGPMADDKVFFEIGRFLSGAINRRQFWVACEFSYPTHQICFATEKAVSALLWQQSWQIGGSSWT